MIKLTVVVEVAKSSLKDKINGLNENYQEQVEAAEWLNMPPPEAPTYFLQEDDLEEISYYEYFDPNDIKRMTRVTGSTVITFYDNTSTIVKETPSKILKLKHEYNQKYPSNIIRIYNILPEFSISNTGGFQSSDDMDND